MLIIEKHIVQNLTQKIRLIDYALSVFSTVSSRSSLKKIIKRQELLVDDIPASSGMWVAENQIITLIDLEQNPPKPLNLPLEIVYEDNHLAIIIKPAGIEVSGNKYHTIQNALIGNISPSNENDALKWPRPVHRLDMPTTGLLIVAKTAYAIMKLGQDLENKKIQKRYRAVVAGNIPDKGEIDIPINGKPALSSFVCIKRYHSLKMQWLSLVDLYPHTGRTHQLRIHLSEYGFPIVGDKKYTTGPLLKDKGLFLSAVGLKFNHPNSGKIIDVTMPQPSKFDGLLSREERRWQRYHSK